MCRITVIVGNAEAHSAVTPFRWYPLKIFEGKDKTQRNAATNTP